MADVIPLRRLRPLTARERAFALDRPGDGHLTMGDCCTDLERRQLVARLGSGGSLTFPKPTRRRSIWRRFLRLIRR
jgi:hypothetical protein